MTPIEALEFALNKEIEARDIYRRFSVEHPAVKEVFFFLANEEEKHKKLIEEKIAELKR